MLKTNLKRVLQAGWKSFLRNSWVSITAILVMTLTLFVILNLLFFNVATRAVLANLKNRVDVSIYFKTDAPEERILKLRQGLTLLENVRSVEYVSRDEALEKFKNKHKDNAVLLRSLEELESNPLEASLNIKAESASEYEMVVNFIENLKSKEIIDKINYKENKDLISRFTNLARNMQNTGLVITLILTLIAVLVTFNTIRLTLYNWREEINVMKLVGAGNWYVRGPFLVEGALYGLSAGLLSLIIVYPLVYFISPRLGSFLPDVNLWLYLNSHLWQIAFFQIIFGILLGGVSSFIAIRRHLKV